MSWKRGLSALGLLSGLSLVIASCAKDPEGFCTGWVDDTCEVLAGCCQNGATFDLEACRIDLSDKCQGSSPEKVHAGQVIFNAGAARECLGSIEVCADAQLVQSDTSFEHVRACANVLTGFRPLGAACSAASECEQAGEFSVCYEGVSGNADGLCAKVVLDEESCSFSFDTFELHACPDGKVCDLGSFTPASTDPPSIRAYEFKAKCVNALKEGASCGGAGNAIPCAEGLYCAVTGPDQAACQKRLGAGAECQFGNECAKGLSCYSDPGSSTATCHTGFEKGPYCFSPTVCGDGNCDSGEDPLNCPSDCGGNCGDGVCDIGEAVTCLDDCCGDGSCDPGENAVCPADCP